MGFNTDSYVGLLICRRESGKKEFSQSFEVGYPRASDNKWLLVYLMVTPILAYK